jgi:hypothetical protein
VLYLYHWHFPNGEEYALYRNREDADQACEGKGVLGSPATSRARRAARSAAGAAPLTRRTEPTRVRRGPGTA